MTHKGGAMSEVIEFIFTNQPVIDFNLIVLVVFFSSFLTTWILTPKIIGIIKFKKLMDNPNSRSSHIEKTPTLGGITFFISSIFALYVIQFFGYNGITMGIIVSLIILFFVGLKDDLMILSAQTKLLAQITAITFVISNPNILITDFNGYFGLGSIPVFLALLLCFTIMIFMINAYNLIDGIDGLAGGLGALMFLTYGIIFYDLEIYFYCLLSFAAFGFLIAFLRYNLSIDKKIFMGDTGTLIVGFIIGYLTLRFLSLSEIEFRKILIRPSNKFLIALAITFFPSIDVIRVILIRIIKKRQPFMPDRSHIHHLLIDKGLSHSKASSVLILCAFLIIVITYFFNMYFDSFLLTLLFSGLIIFVFGILLILDSDQKTAKLRQKVKNFFPKQIQSAEFRLRKKIIISVKKLFFKDLLSKK